MTQRQNKVVDTAWTASFEKRLREGSRLVASAGLLTLSLLTVVSCMGPEVKQSDVVTESRGRRLTAEPWVRVLLVDGVASAKLALKGLCAIHSADPRSGEATVHGPVASLDGLQEAAVSADGKGIVIAGQARYSGAILLRPQESNAFTLNGTRYGGEMLLKSENGKLRVINVLNLESYLIGVIGREMPLGFPDAALEAQAIAARTYACWQLRAGENRDHDLKSDTRSQVYGGVSEHPKAVEIINRTRGQVATYKGQIFETFFHSTCGGQTIPAFWVFGGKHFEPLSGADCGRCMDSKYYRWREQTNRTNLVSKLREKGVSVVEPVTEIETVSWDRGNYQHYVLIKHAGGISRMEATKFRSALGLRSSAFNFHEDKGTFQIDGEGWGHGVGLCQFGARGFAREGKSGTEIILHFYPGSEVEKQY